MHIRIYINAISKYLEIWEIVNGQNLGEIGILGLGKYVDKLMSTLLNKLLQWF